MYTDYDLDMAQEELVRVRTNNKERINANIAHIKDGYRQHGIIFTSSAESYGIDIDRLKAQVTVLTKKRNAIKKYLKNN